MILRRVSILLLGVLNIVVAAALGFVLYYAVLSANALARLGPEAPVRYTDGAEYRDLNKNGVLDSYENTDAPVSERVQDLLNRMTLEEKAGMVFITMIAMEPDGSLQERPALRTPFTFLTPTTSSLIVRRRMNHFSIMQGSDPESMARWHNNVQNLAERTRLGIPVTVASYPRHGYPSSPATHLPARGFSAWPEPVGLAATRDTQLVARFAEVVRQEYLAVGIRQALHPMVDLATEPRWSRIHGTFGEDAELAARMTRAYVGGLQGASIGKESVAAMAKHFPGGGPQDDGWEAHFSYGKDQVYPGDRFAYHLAPFVQGALPAGAAQIMVGYGVGVGISDEEVGFAFSRDVVTDLLRNQLGFEGVISTDWAVLSDKRLLGRTLVHSPGWGVEELSPVNRAEKALHAGVDLFGGESNPEWIVELVETGRVEEARLEQSVRRLLQDKFLLGLFDNPYVDVDAAREVVGAVPFVEAGIRAQQASVVLLKNVEMGGSPVLPLGAEERLYIENIDSSAAARYATVVGSMAEATVALVRLHAPYERQPGDGMLENMFHQGDLDFKGAEKERILALMNRLPTIVDIYLDRPAVIPEIAANAAGLLANFGASDEVILNAVFGRFEPSGRLPFEMPSSMQAVRDQLEDEPYDSEDPLFPFDFGLRYTEPDTSLTPEGGEPALPG